MVKSGVNACNWDDPHPNRYHEREYAALMHVYMLRTMRRPRSVDVYSSTYGEREELPDKSS